MAVNRELGFPTKLSYGVGQAAEGIKNACFSAYLFFYYAAVLGLSPELVGTALFVALVFDAVTDPLAGYFSDRLRSRFGRRHPFMLAAAVPLAVAFYCLFNPPALSESGLFAWLLIFSVLTRGAMTLYHVPHLSLGAELSTDYSERTVIVAFRFFFSYVGAIAAFLIGFMAFFVATPDYPRGQFNREAYHPFALTMSFLMTAGILVTTFGTARQIPHLPKAPDRPSGQSAAAILREMFGAFLGALRRPNFAWLFSGVLIVFMMVGVDNALNLHMNTYFWELGSRANAWFFAASPVGVLLGTLFARRLNDRFDKKACIIFGTGWWTLCQVAPIVMRLAGCFPENGTEALVWTLIGIKFIQGVGVAQSLVSFNSMVPDVVDEHELETGRRQEGVFFALVSFSAKGTTGLGNFVAGVALALIGWPRGVDVRSAADVGPELINWLGLLYGPIVSGFAVVAIWCYTRHRLDRAEHQRIVMALAVRQQRSGEA